MCFAIHHSRILPIIIIFAVVGVSVCVCMFMKIKFCAH